MRILAIADIHGNIATLSKIVNKVRNNNIDLILVAGDLTNFGHYNEAKSVISILSEFKKNILCSRKLRYNKRL
jgi:Predicted phosphohydrolases